MGVHGQPAIEGTHHCGLGIQSLARAAGVGRHSFVHRLRIRMEHLQSAVDSCVRRRHTGRGRLAAVRRDLDFHGRDHLPRAVGGRGRQMARERRTPKGRHGGGALLGRRLLGRRSRNSHASALARVFRVRRDRRLRPRLGLRLSGQHVDTLVSGPARHGSRHGDHGFRRRSDHRRAVETLPDSTVLRGARLLRHGRPGESRDRGRPEVCRSRRAAARSRGGWRQRPRGNDRPGTRRRLRRGHGQRRRRWRLS